MMKKIMVFIIVTFLVHVTALSGSIIDPDNTQAATKELLKQKALIRQNIVNGKTDVLLIKDMLNLGMWEDARKALSGIKSKADSYQILRAGYLVLNNNFEAAEKIVNPILKQQPGNEEAILIKAFLEIQAWRLQNAAAISETALKKNPSEKLSLMVGRVKLLQKDYVSALSIAQKIIEKNPHNAAAYLLEADVYFWDQHPEKAEAPLRKSLKIDPFNADARFSYGYAIWRRIDATQLNAMAAQWELALAVNPLHFQTHWHWGNGHTNLTYADYAEKNDDEVREALNKADDEIRKNHVQTAIDISRQVEKQYPNSILPLMQRGSVYYMSFDMDRKIRLDSAENIFKTILERKKHYGPAHNGLSAVIKSKRISYLASYDSITNALNQTKIDDPVNFEKVFSDVAYYPGDIVKAMVWNQMYAAVVYFPFLSKQNRTFHVPPLHIDLATSMNSSYFRFGTTFDNRQWMDIRGVGSGAAAIEYVERGAYRERNVVLHEYVHLFHGMVLTDEENRQIRALYYNAMKENRTLDYYSQNNESEYFAQTYPAYFEAVKVHPLDFKSMNTTNDLKTKDPEMYRFLDDLVKRQKAYLAGDKKALSGNWAQVYLNLGNIALRSKNYDLASNYLDTALTFESKYLPVYLGYASLKKEQQKFIEAASWLGKAERINPDYAPIYVAYASLSKSKMETDKNPGADMVAEQLSYLKKAYKLEKDFQETARIAMMLRETYKENALVAEAIDAADEYVQNGATVSTYLRDRKDDALAFSEVLKSSLGYKQPIEILGKLVAQKPQNFEYRNYYADALVMNGQYDDAIATLKEAQRILLASGNARPDYNLRIAEFYQQLGQEDSAKAYLETFSDKKMRLQGRDSLRYIRLLNAGSLNEKADSLFRRLSPGVNPWYDADYYFTKGILLNSGGNNEGSNIAFAKAIELNPYLLEAYISLIKSYKINQENSKINILKVKLNELKTKPDMGYINSFF